MVDTVENPQFKPIYQQPNKVINTVLGLDVKSLEP